MITDEEIKLEGMKALVEVLGNVQAERFISLIMRALFDYTKWQQKLWVNHTIADISRAAMGIRDSKQS